MNMLKQGMAPVVDMHARAGEQRRRPCLSGLYLLTATGGLARFDDRGELLIEGELNESLALRLQAVLQQYRSGAAESLSLALVDDSEIGSPWNSGTLIFSARARRELFQNDRADETGISRGGLDSGIVPLRWGMNLLLGGAGSPSARFCPVLFPAEAESEFLHERYGIDCAVDRPLFEVLDLAAPFASNGSMPDDLLAIVHRMRATIQHASPAGPAGEQVDRWQEPPVDSGFNDGDAVTGWLLESFTPFNVLTDTQREIIAGYETIRKAPSGTVLIERGSRDDLCVYLVEGALALAGPDGATMLVKAGTPRARLPISVLSPHVYDVTAVSDVSIIVFSQKLVRRIIDITTTYTSVGSRQGTDASTSVISNGVQGLYLSRDYPARLNPNPRN